jgi:hypothetical protein
MSEAEVRNLSRNLGTVRGIGIGRVKFLQGEWPFNLSRILTKLAD